MRCPFCNAEDTKVIDSRLANEGEAVRRRRECLTCVERFTTYETVEVTLPRVVKRDGTREVFDESKLRGGLQRALERRPVATEAVEGVIHRIMRRMRSSGEREITTHHIGTWVMEELRELDQIAYVRFASVYRSFQDVSEFREEVDRLEKQPSAELRERQIKLIPDIDDLPVNKPR
ncbi:MAG: transcriptional regulator NrdR [Gammaproteobacteria bacterium]|nr:transcriptional regulator NrdR [Gammaproteobacteria bacterium]